MRLQGYLELSSSPLRTTDSRADASCSAITMAMAHGADQFSHVPKPVALLLALDEKSNEPRDNNNNTLGSLGAGMYVQGKVWLCRNRSPSIRTVLCCGTLNVTEDSLWLDLGDTMARLRRRQLAKVST